MRMQCVCIQVCNARKMQSKEKKSKVKKRKVNNKEYKYSLFY